MGGAASVPVAEEMDREAALKLVNDLYDSGNERKIKEVMQAALAGYSLALDVEEIEEMLALKKLKLSAVANALGSAPTRDLEIKFKDMSQTIDKLTKDRASAMLRKVFALCDADGNGVIDYEEATTFLLHSRDVAYSDQIQRNPEVPTSVEAMAITQQKQMAHYFIAQKARIAETLQTKYGVGNIDSISVRDFGRLAQFFVDEASGARIERMYEVLCRKGVMIEDMKADALFGFADANGSGTIQYQEMVDFLVMGMAIAHRLSGNEKSQKELRATRQHLLTRRAKANLSQQFVNTERMTRADFRKILYILNKNSTPPVSTDKLYEIIIEKKLLTVGQQCDELFAFADSNGNNTLQYEEVARFILGIVLAEAKAKNRTIDPKEVEKHIFGRDGKAQLKRDFCREYAVRPQAIDNLTKGDFRKLIMYIEDTSADFKLHDLYTYFLAQEARRQSVLV